MIETLHELTLASGIERMNLSIQADSKSKATVVVQCILGAAPKDATDEQQKLREALSQPIVIRGVVGEVDAKLDSLLTDYVRSVQPFAESIETSTEKAKEKVTKAGKEATKTKGGDDAASTEASSNATDEEAASFTSEDTTSL